MKPIGTTVTVNRQGEADVHGIDYGPLYFFHEEGGHLVLKNPSHLTWSGRGQRRSVPGQLVVFRVLAKGSAPNGNKRYKVEGVVTIPLRQTQFLAAQGGAAEQGGKKTNR